MLLPLSKLFIDDANPRTRRDPLFVKQLAASIAAEGLLNPLTVKGPYPDGRYGVTRGGSRLEALALNHPGEDPEVACEPEPELIAEDPARLRSAALAENVMRADLHPVDAFEAFAALAKEGFAEAHIAERYGVEPKIVRQRLALARLAPEIRAAWRAGEIDAETAEAFTLSADQKQQKEVFNKLGAGKRDMWSGRVRSNLIGDHHDAERFLAFVGQEAYEAAGGRCAHFLFADEEDAADIVLDFPILKNLAEARIAAECARLKKQGWGFADPKDSHKNHYNYRTVTAKTKEEKAAAGCLVSVGHDGKLVIDRGLVLPGKKVKKSGTGNREPGTGNREPGTGKTAPSPAHPGESRDPSSPEEVSNKPLPSSLVADLSKAFTFAAQDAVATDQDLALRLAVAALIVRDSDFYRTHWPVTLRHAGCERDDEDNSGSCILDKCADSRTRSR